MFITNEKILERILKLSIAGTRGGLVRLQILLILQKKATNINQLAKYLNLDYTTIQHHIRVLIKSYLIASSNKKYKNEYMLSPMLNANTHILEELKENIGKSK